jgi:hypothetical protein
MLNCTCGTNHSWDRTGRDQSPVPFLIRRRLPDRSDGNQDLDYLGTLSVGRHYVVFFKETCAFETEVLAVKIELAELRVCRDAWTFG